MSPASLLELRALADAASGTSSDRQGAVMKYRIVGDRELSDGAPFDRSAPYTLAHNLAIAGALVAAYREGVDECGGWFPGNGDVFPGYETAADCRAIAKGEK